MKNKSAARLLVLLAIGAVLVVAALFFQHGRFSEARKREMLDDIRIIPSYGLQQRTILTMFEQAHEEVFPDHYGFAGRGFNPNDYRDDLVAAMKRMANEQGHPHLIVEFNALLPMD